MWSGFITSGGAASASWWGFDPLSESIHSPGSGMDLWIFGVMLATLGHDPVGRLHPGNGAAPPRAGDDVDADAGVHVDDGRDMH